MGNCWKCRVILHNKLRSRFTARSNPFPSSLSPLSVGTFWGRGGNTVATWGIFSRCQCPDICQGVWWVRDTTDVASRTLWQTFALALASENRFDEGKIISSIIRMVNTQRHTSIFWFSPPVAKSLRGNIARKPMGQPKSCVLCRSSCRFDRNIWVTDYAAGTVSRPHALAQDDRKTSQNNAPSNSKRSHWSQKSPDILRVLVTLRIGYELERKQCHVTQSNIFQTPLTIYESFRASSIFSENTEGKLS